MDLYRIFITLLLLVSLIAFHISAQQFVVKNYNLEEGIESNIIHDVQQDKNGNIWFATESGVSVYNASVWKNYSTDEGLPENEYLYLRLDRENILWAVPYNSSNAIAYLKNNHWFLFNKFSQNVYSKYLFTSFEIIYDHNEKVLCFGTANGLFLYKGQNIFRFTKQDGLPDNKINGFCKINERLYICTDNGFSYYSDGRIINLPLNFPSKKIHAAYISDNNKNVIWLLGDNWIGKVVNHQLEVLYRNVEKFFSHQNQRHSFIIFDGIERIFCGNEFEMYYYDLKRKQLFNINQENGFATSGSSKVILDSESNLWFCTYRGIDKLSSQRFLNYYKSTGLFDNEVSAILEVRKDFLIFGHNKGLTIYRDGIYKTIDFSVYSDDPVISRRVMSLYKDKKNNVWIAASYLGIGKLVNDKIKWIRHNKLLSYNTITEDSHNNLLIGTNEGIYKLENEKLLPVATKNEGVSYIRQLYVDDSGNLFATMPFGIAKYSDGKLELYDEKKINSAENIYVIFKYDSVLLLGTKNGLYTLDRNDAVKPFTQGNFKIEKIVFTIERGQDNSYWFGTNDGVYNWNGSHSNHFNLENGLTGREVNRSSVICDSYGNMWIGTDRGISCYFPEYERTENISNVIIERIQASGENVISSNGEIHLSSNVNELVFNFRAVSFVNEYNINYRVMLEGFDDKWIDNGNSRTIRYTNLKPGEYKFLVCAKNKNNDWSRITYSKTIIVNKQFYLQWWFMLFIILILSFIIYLIYNYRFQIKYSIQLEKEVELRTEKLKKSQYELEQSNIAKDKFFSIIAHDLKSPFQGLLGLINYISTKFDELRVDDIKEYLLIIKDSTTKLLDLIVQLLEWSRLQTGNIEFDLKNFNFHDEVIIPSIDLLKVISDAKDIKIINRVDKDLFVKADINSYRMIVDNLLSNAIKFTRDSGKIIIENKESDGLYEISISDTGIGMEKEKIKKLFLVGENTSTRGTSGEIGTGLGLILCKELLEKNGHKISVTSEPGKGSTFYFTIEKAKEGKPEII